MLVFVTVIGGRVVSGTVPLRIVDVRTTVVSGCMVEGVLLDFEVGLGTHWEYPAS